MPPLPNGFQPFGPSRPVRRQSFVTLHRRRSQRLDNLQNFFTEDKTPNSLKEPYSFVHVFTLLLCITRNMKCKICKQLFMDVTVLNCGHVFCKFCLTTWLGSKENCPICLKTEVHPVCNRCYNLDSIVVSFYHQLLEILDPNDILSSVPTASEQGSTHPNDNPQSSQIRTRLEVVQTMEKIRLERRQAMIGASCMVRSWSCPNRSMLQGVTDLGFGLRNSMEGFLLLVIGSFFLATAVCQFSDIMESYELLAIRRICYVVMIIYLICSQRTPFFRPTEEDSMREIFWDQIFQSKVTEQLDPLFQNERKRMMVLVRKKQIDLTTVQREVTSIIDKLGVFEQSPEIRRP